MGFENSWVTYLQRSYKGIKASLLARMETVLPEITDRSESNIFVIILSSFAGLVEQLNYYIDNMAREMYLPTARRYSSLVKITRLIDYRVKAKVSSTVDLLVTAVDSGGNPINLIDDRSILAGSIIKTTDNIEFITLRDRTIFLGNSSVYIPAKQRKLYSNQNIGTTTSSANQAFKLDPDYTDGSLQVTINNMSWELKETLAFSGPRDRHFIVEVTEAKEAWLIFGDNIHGMIPLAGYSILATFHKCLGGLGNVIEDTITTWVIGKPSGGGATDYTVTNPYKAAGGLDVEDLERIRRHAPLSIRTLNRAVTLQDHIDIALLTPGVGKVAVSFDSALKVITIYAAPDGGGTASSTLLNDIVDFFSTRKMISTVVIAKPCGETNLRISLTATAKFRRSAEDTRDDITNALLTNFGFNYSDVNKGIRKSDIIALVDNLDKVDFLSLDILTTKPYPRRAAGINEIDPIWYVEVTPFNTVKTLWRIYIVDPIGRVARVYRSTTPGGDYLFDGLYNYSATDPITPDYTSVDGSLKFGFYGSGYSEGDIWEFTTYPYNQDLVFDDFTVPVASLSELSITVNEQII